MIINHEFRDSEVRTHGQPPISKLAEVDRLEEDQVLDRLRSGLCSSFGTPSKRSTKRTSLLQDLSRCARTAGRDLDGRRDSEELATYEDLDERSQAEIASTSNKLTRRHLKTLEDEVKRLSASVPSDARRPGDRVRTFVGDGDRQYLTGPAK